MKSLSSHISLVRELLSTDHVGVEKGTVFKELRPWAAFKTGDFR